MSPINDTHLSSQQLFLSSSHANQVLSDSNCIWHLPTPINPPPPTRILISVVDFECPYSFYNINSSNNILKFTGITQIEITKGNYNINTLLTFINEQLDIVASNITASYITNQNQMRFTSTFGSISIDTTASTCLFEIGFNKNDVQVATTIQGTNGVNLAGIPNIYIRIKNISTNNLDSGVLASTLCKVNVTVNPLEYIFHVPNEAIYQLVKNTNFNFIHLSLEDENGINLELNGGIWSISIGIHYQLYREPILPKILDSQEDLAENKNEQSDENKNDDNIK
tara:strand:+ start:2087 stop:2932 length:846 start_codon:yes stop_codon:yes gene_type:complete